MKEEIKKIMARVFDMDQADIPDDMSIETHEVWESFRHINLILALEEAYSVRFAGDEVMEVVSLPKIIESLEKKSKQS